MPVAEITIYDYTARIRDLINAPRKQTLLLKNRDAWLQLCSSLDAIGDTDLALDSYLADQYPTTIGAQYVVVYGTLQVLYVQQNAVGHLLAALSINIKPKEYPRLSRIRNIRAESIGHPTRKSAKGGIASYHFITRVTLNKNGFMLLSNRPDGSTRWEQVIIPSLVAEQRADVADVLQRVIAALEMEEEEHREEHRGRNMEDLLPASLAYHFSKIAEATAGKPTDVGAALGLANISVIRRALEEFRNALVKRGLDETWRLSESIDEIIYPLNEIETFFNSVRNGVEPHINERLAYICAFFAQHRVEALRETAREIDETYRRPASEKK